LRITVLTRHIETVPPGIKKQETPPTGGVFRFAGIVIFSLSAPDEMFWEILNGHIRKSSI
jgi:UDP-N-acetylmuramyl pentapeptide phosphotransferase/UDP-N-acetylglucosamine-1-phosphate transferase